MKTLKKLITKKQKGISDMIASLLVVLALTIFVLFFIQMVGNVNTKIQIDQVARTYMLRMETTGTLTPTEAANLKTALSNIDAVKKGLADNETDSTKGIIVKVNGGEPTSTSAGYGETITLSISCPVETRTFIVGDTDSTFGSFKRKVITYTVNKQSTAKY